MSVKIQSRVAPLPLSNPLCKATAMKAKARKAKAMKEKANKESPLQHHHFLSDKQNQTSPTVILIYLLCA